MRKLWCLLAATLLLAALLPACAGDEEAAPFEGTWVAVGARLVFEGATWRDDDGDTGEFTYTGSYPVFTLTMTTTLPAGTPPPAVPAQPAVKQATFLDENTMRLCDLAINGTVVNCKLFARDEPIIPG